jgi:antitoxin (DNA-binding transcriptional repressor) of toxin-antitoxin stability system
MKRTGIAELKARLSHYLSRVKAGEEIFRGAAIPR